MLKIKFMFQSNLFAQLFHEKFCDAPLHDLIQGELNATVNHCSRWKCVQKMLLQEIRLKNGFIKILFEDFFINSEDCAISELEAREMCQKVQRAINSRVSSLCATRKSSLMNFTLRKHSSSPTQMINFSI